MSLNRSFTVFNRSFVSFNDSFMAFYRSVVPFYGSGVPFSRSGVPFNRSGVSFCCAVEVPSTLNHFIYKCRAPCNPSSHRSMVPTCLCLPRVGLNQFRQRPHDAIRAHGAGFGQACACKVEPNAKDAQLLGRVHIPF